MTDKLYTFKVAGTVRAGPTNDDIKLIRHWCECAIDRAANHAAANYNVHIQIELIGDDHKKEIID